MYPSTWDDDGGRERKSHTVINICIHPLYSWDTLVHKKVTFIDQEAECAAGVIDLLSAEQRCRSLEKELKKMVTDISPVPGLFGSVWIPLDPWFFMIFMSDVSWFIKQKIELQLV